MEITQIANQKFLLLGIGINVNQIHWEKMSKATSLCKLSGEVVDIPRVMNALLFSLDEIWENMSDLHTEYRNLLWKIGQKVILDAQSITQLNPTVGENVSGLLQDVDQLGRIVILDSNDKLLAFHHGQVHLRFS